MLPIVDINLMTDHLKEQADAKGCYLLGPYMRNYGGRETNGVVFWRFQDRRNMPTIVCDNVTISSSSGVLLTGKNDGDGDLQPGRDLVHEIHEWLLTRYPDLQDLGSDILIYGETQSEKTGYILAILWMKNYIDDLHTSLILDNSRGNFAQVMARIADFNTEIIQRFGDRARAATLRPISVQQLPDTVNDWSPRHTVVLMGNKSQMGRFSKFMRVRPAVVFDESDTAIKGADESTDRSAVGPDLRDLREHARFTAEVSATPFAQMNTVSERRPPRIVQVPKSPDYRNALNHEYVLYPDNDHRIRLLQNGDPDVAVQEVTNLRDRLRERVQKSRSQKYLAILLNTTRKIRNQIRMGIAIATRTNMNVWLRNSQDSTHPVQRITRDGIVEPYTSCLTLADLFNEFERLGEWSENIVIAGDTAKRGVSFRPSRDVGSGGLHGMIYLPSPTAHAAAIVQAGGRTDGKFGDDYPMIIIKTSQGAYQKRNAEIFYNYPSMLERVGDEHDDRTPRQKIENIKLIHVGSHDRGAVDDTHLEECISIMKHDFDTPDALLAFLDSTPGLFRDGHQFMTEASYVITIPGISNPPADVRERNGAWRRKKHEEIKQALGLHRNTNMVLSLHPCDNQFAKAHNMMERFNPHSSGAYCKRYIAGATGVGDQVRVVRWAARFSIGDNGYARPDVNDVAYLFETTQGKWRFFCTKEKRRFGRLVH